MAMRLDHIVSAKSSAYKTGDRVIVVSLNRSWLGTYVNSVLRKFVGHMATVADVVPGKRFDVIIQPDGYTSYIMVTADEIKK